MFEGGARNAAPRRVRPQALDAIAKIGRGGPNRPKTTAWDVRYQITAVRRNGPAIRHRVERLGWQVQVINLPAERLSLGDALWTYRGGWSAERLFHLFKDQPLGIRPFYVRRDDRILGLTHLVTLGLRVLTLFEVLVRRGQEHSGEELPGLYPGQAKRVTDRPTAKRVLEAVSRARITLTQNIKRRMLDDLGYGLMLEMMANVMRGMDS